MIISGMLLDLDNVVLDTTYGYRWLFGQLSKIRPNLQFADMMQVLQHQFWPAVYAGFDDAEWALKRYLQQEGVPVGQSSEWALATVQKQRAALDTVQPLPGVARALTRLSQHSIRLGVLCNWQSDWAAVDSCLANLGIGGRFQAIVTSVDMGRTMPTTDGFNRACEQLVCEPREVIYVGGHSESVARARQLGLTAVGIGPWAVPSHLHLQAIEQLIELPFRFAPAARVAA